MISDCRLCADFDWCAEHEDCGLFKQKPLTHADRIRAMTDEELAEFMANNVGCDDCRFFATCRSAPQDRACADKWLEWLKREVAE